MKESELLATEMMKKAYESGKVTERKRVLRELRVMRKMLREHKEQLGNYPLIVEIVDDFQEWIVKGMDV
jgi:hypothetical protein